MPDDFAQQLQEAHALLDMLAPDQLEVVRTLLEVMCRDDDEFTEDDRVAIAEAIAYLREETKGQSIDKSLGECDFTIGPVRDTLAD